MRWRLAIAFAIIALIIAAGTASLRYTDMIYNRMLESLEVAAQGGESAEKALADANKLWNENMTFICVISGDAHVDSVNMAFARALSLVGQRDTEYHTAVTDIISGVRHLRDYDRPSVHSIF